MSNYYNPVKIIKTENWLLELNKNIKNLEISAPIIVTTPGNRKRLSLDSKFNPGSIFSDVGDNPNFDDCINAVEFCQKNVFSPILGSQNVQKSTSRPTLGVISIPNRIKKPRPTHWKAWNSPKILEKLVGVTSG